jgi:hypothetical protein
MIHDTVVSPTGRDATPLVRHAQGNAACITSRRARYITPRKRVIVLVHAYMSFTTLEA